MKNNIILSICIPTYNRSFYLDKVLKNITTQKIFIETDKVEVIISDNNSFDDTKIISEKYVKKFGNKVKYFCNDENLEGMNMEIALSRANGQFLKIVSDYLLIKNNYLSKIINLVKENSVDKPVLFFSNSKKDNNFVFCKNLDEFIKEASFYNTWYGAFGIWKEDFDNFNDFSKYVSLKLPQTYVLCKMVAIKKKAYIVNEEIFKIMTLRNKSGYNVAEVFGKNYLLILKEFIKNGELSKSVYNNEKKKIFLKHTMSHYFDFNNKNSFSKGYYLKYLKDYYFNLYFWLSFFTIFTKILKIVLYKLFLSEIKIKKKLWKKNNKNNKVKLIDIKKVSCDNINKIFIGDYSYGNIKAHFWGSCNEKIIIGRFVSIASAVFLCGGNHSYKGLSTFPFKVVFFNEKREALSKGEIIIEDDVWIGEGVTILSGVKIGQGAIVAAGSIVSKNVEPYSIVAGNPAKTVKYRFNEKIRNIMSEFNFEFLDKEKILKSREVLYEELTKDNASRLIDKIKD